MVSQVCCFEPIRRNKFTKHTVTCAMYFYSLRIYISKTDQPEGLYNIFILSLQTFSSADLPQSSVFQRHWDAWHISILARSWSGWHRSMGWSIGMKKEREWIRFKRLGSRR